MRRRTVDIAFISPRLAVFVDGCFWHSCPEHATSPVANGSWWAEKLEGNRTRDLATNAYLVDLGWRVIRIWEHEDVNEAVQRIVDRLAATTLVNQQELLKRG
jgi:DNA mismatch endonuclease, patch repair protein